MTTAGRLQPPFLFTLFAMQNEPIAWTEGMFLRPHQMQAAERSIHETIVQHSMLDQGYSYGIRRISFSKEAIANGQFELTECQARLKDGTVVWLSVGQQPDRVNLSGKDLPSSRRADLIAKTRDLDAALDGDESIDVFIGVPKLRMGRANIGGHAGGQHRFVAAESELPDENSGGNPQSIGQRILNVQILLGSDNLAGFETLQIARIKRSGAADGAPQLDADYVPPVLACDAWPELGRDFVRAVYDIIGTKVDSLSTQINSRGIMKNAPHAGDINRLMMLSALNQGLATLQSLAFASGVHPLVAYTELCRIVGSLSIFRGDRKPGEIPRYDHDDLARIFRWVREEIRSLITEVEADKFERRDFVGAGRGLQVDLTQKWLGSNWELFIGVQFQGIDASQCRELLRPGRLYWKLGPSHKVDFMFRNAVIGLEKQLEEVDPPRILPQSVNWLFFAVHQGGKIWEQLSGDEEPTLAVRFDEDLIMNIDDLIGQTDLMIEYQQISATLRLAFFAIPTVS